MKEEAGEKRQKEKKSRGKGRKKQRDAVSPDPAAAGREGLF